MVRLQKSIDKRSALLKATLNLINNGGIQEASMAKIAKVANVSPATIYLYFKNKQDLINQLYLEVKTAFALAAFNEYDPTKPVRKCFEQIWFNMAEFKISNIEEGSFLSQCDNTPMIDESTRQQGIEILKPLFELMQKGQNEGIIKDISPYLLYAFTIYPLAFLSNMQNYGYYNLSTTVLNAAFKAAWDSIKV